MLSAILALAKEHQQKTLQGVREIQLIDIALSEIRDRVEKRKTVSVNKLVYGFYIPNLNIDVEFSHDEAKRHANDMNYAIDGLLISVSETHVTCLSIEELVLLNENLTTSYGQGLLFAAFISCHSDTEFKEPKIAFLKSQSMIPTNLLRRMGLFAFICEETNDSSPLTIDNWASHIEQP